MRGANFSWFRLSVFTLSIACSCSDPAPQKPKKISPEKLYGQWRSVYLRLEMHTYRDTGATETFEVNEANWIATMGMQPIRTYFWPNGAYNSLHYDVNDSLLMNPWGRWKLEGDTLVMQDTFPRLGEEFRYRVRLQEDIAEFTGYEDSDGDGEKDDLYYGTSRKFTTIKFNLSKPEK